MGIHTCITKRLNVISNFSSCNSFMVHNTIQYGKKATVCSQMRLDMLLLVQFDKMIQQSIFLLIFQNVSLPKRKATCQSHCSSIEIIKNNKAHALNLSMTLMLRLSVPVGYFCQNHNNYYVDVPAGPRKIWLSLYLLFLSNYPPISIPF